MTIDPDQIEKMSKKLDKVRKDLERQIDSQDPFAADPFRVQGTLDKVLAVKKFLDDMLIETKK
ncbi:MAG: hypothetical protein WC824_11955 [Bacteroidota bacterium]|jgi:hypothetical protein